MSRRNTLAAKAERRALRQAPTHAELHRERQAEQARVLANLGAMWLFFTNLCALLGGH